jgi:CheY-like chemotaxis protein
VATILVVDDDPTIRKVLTWAFDDAGYTVETAANGAEALTRYDASTIDLIVSDVMMPEVDGYTLVASLRGFDTWPPVILLSAAARPRCDPPCVHALPKPFDLDTLLRLVAETLRYTAY